MPTTLTEVCRMAVAIEISAAKWVVASIASVAGKIRRKVLGAESVTERFESLVEEVCEARKKLNVPADAPVLIAYEAGQEGFWLVRALRARGFNAEVIDPVSLQVDRRSRRAKTDRLDAEALVRALWRYQGGEAHALRMVRVLSEAEEDDREWQRERDRLKAEKCACSDRIRKKLRTQGLWHLPKDWRQQLRAGTLRRFAGTPLGKMLRTAMEIELKRLELVEDELKGLEARLSELNPKTQERIDALYQLKAIGAIGSRSLAMLLYWRTFENQRQVGACVGLVGTPYDSGTMRQDQGISKAGDPRLRSLLIELAWMWLRYQPESDLAKWFVERTSGGGKRHKRVMIVAVARKLAIALWRYLDQGVMPAGAQFKEAKA